jgi:hypothetical protein
MITIETSQPAAEKAYVPTRDAIIAALKDLPTRFGQGSGATWYGPSPRITRVSGGPSGQVVTTIQWPVELDGTSINQALASDAIAGAARGAIADAASGKGTTTAAAVNFEPSVFGEQSVWQSGQAATTNTADRPAEPGEQRDDPAYPGRTLDSATPTNWKTIGLVVGAAAVVTALVLWGGDEKRSNPHRRSIYH